MDTIPETSQWDGGPVNRYDFMHTQDARPTQPWPPPAGPAASAPTSRGISPPPIPADSFAPPPALTRDQWKPHYTKEQCEWLLKNCTDTVRMEGGGGWLHVAQEYEAAFGQQRLGQALRTKYHRLRVERGGAPLRGSVRCRPVQRGCGKDVVDVVVQRREVMVVGRSGVEMGIVETGVRPEHVEKQNVHHGQQNFRPEQQECYEQQMIIHPGQQERYEQQIIIHPGQQERREQQNVRHVHQEMQGIPEASEMLAMVPLQPVQQLSQREWLLQNIHMFQNTYHETDWQLLADLFNYDIAIEKQTTVKALRAIWDRCVWENAGCPQGYS